jgi:signal transduction histidine kinase
MTFVDQQARRLTRLVENLLAFAQGANRRQPKPEPMDLSAFLEDTVVAFEPIAHAHGQQARLEPSERRVVAADRDWLTQIVLNLLDNAVKYGPTGQTITVRAASDARHARIIVDDEGPGVPPGARNRIFAPFVRLSREQEQRSGGTGIGLAVAADLATAMNARIWADERASGARFIVELPLAESEPALRAHTGSAAEPAGRETHTHVA